jgi:epoxide hydrolase 4
MRRHLLTDFRQIRRSWYIFFFQLPWLPERALRRGLAARALRGTSRRGTFSDEDLARYQEAWAQPDAMRSMVNWYRAAIRGAARPAGPWRVPVETLVLWGVRDTALGREMVAPSLALCDHGRSVFFERATHWIQHEEPAAVNDLLLRFLAGGLDAIDAARTAASQAP